MLLSKHVIIQIKDVHYTLTSLVMLPLRNSILSITELAI